MFGILNAIILDDQRTYTTSRRTHPRSIGIPPATTKMSNNLAQARAVKAAKREALYARMAHARRAKVSARRNPFNFLPQELLAEVARHVSSVGDLSAFTQVSWVARERLLDELFRKAVDPRVANVNRWRSTIGRRHDRMRDYYLEEATVVDSPALEGLLNQCSNPDVEVRCDGQLTHVINVLAPCSPLHLEDLFLEAVRQETETTTGILIGRGVRCNLSGLAFDDKAKLHGAIFYGSEFLLRLLLNRGEDVNQRDNRLRTALYIAAECRLPNMVAMLLEFGADVDLRIRGKTALRIAVETLENEWFANYDHLSHVVKQLMAAGADATESGALHKAAVLGEAGIVQLMLKGGANPAERCTAMELWEMRDISTRPATALECFGMQVHRRQREAAYILRHQIATLDDEFYAAEEEIRRLLS